MLDTPLCLRMSGAVVLFLMTCTIVPCQRFHPERRRKETRMTRAPLSTKVKSSKAYEETIRNGLGGTVARLYR